MPTVRLQSVTKSYRKRDRDHKGPAVSDINFQFDQGDFIFLTGSRGAGKTTLMDLIAGELTPDQGAVFVDEVNLRRLGMVQRARYRRSVGRVHQDSQLVKNQTVLQNLSGDGFLQKLRGQREIRQRALKCLGLVGMTGFEFRYPAEMNTSQCKRVELAKAILYTPSILLLDEITERTDEDTVWDILHLLTELNDRLNTTIIKRVVTLSDGRIVGDVRKGRLGYIN